MEERQIELTERDRRLAMSTQQMYKRKYELPTRIRKSHSESPASHVGEGTANSALFDSGRHNFLRMNYVAYLTDFISVGPETLLMLPLEDEATLFLSPAWDMERAREESWVKNVQPVNDLWNRLGDHIGKAGLIGREAMNVDLHDELVRRCIKRPLTLRTYWRIWRARKANSSWNGCVGPRPSPTPACKRYMMMPASG